MKSAEGRRPSALNRAYSSVPELYDTPTSPAMFRRRILTWYGRSGRDLPWRRTQDPYRVLVSEVMLQQTQVSRVLPVYRRFLRRFPTLGALSRAPLGEVLREWSGLGYNRRARDLHGIARLHSSGFRDRRRPRCAPRRRRVHGVRRGLLRARPDGGVRRDEHPPGAGSRVAGPHRDRSRGDRARRAFWLETPERAVASRAHGHRRDDLHRQAPAVRCVSGSADLQVRRDREAIAAKAITFPRERSARPRRDRAASRDIHWPSHSPVTSNAYQRRARAATRTGTRARGSRGGLIRDDSSSESLI